MHNVFAGADSLKQFLNPEQHITPLVELPAFLNPFLVDGVHIFLKMQNFLPLANVKSISARGMLNQVQNISQYKGLVENSSGNTAFSLAVLGRLFGIETMKARVSNEVTEGKLKLLQLFGVQSCINKEQICPNPKDPESGIQKAKAEAKLNWWLNPGQYDNLANPDIHYHLTAPQIREQLQFGAWHLNPKIFCAGLWTSGSFLGISKFLKEKKSDFLSLGVVRKPNNPIPWPRTEHLLQEVSFDREHYLDEMEAIGTKQAYEMSLSLVRNGLLVWPSSWMALCWLFTYLEKIKKSDKLKELTQEQEISAVVLCPDGPFLYIDEYFKYCEKDQFPPIENEELLTNKVNNRDHDNENVEIDPLFFYELTKEHNQHFAEENILIDLRSFDEFEHVHIKNAINLPFEQCDKNSFINYKDKRIFLVCNFWKKSNFWADTLAQLGFNVYSLKWGLVAWSNLGLPREKAKSCQIK